MLNSTRIEFKWIAVLHAIYFRSFLFWKNYDGLQKIELKLFHLSLKYNDHC